MTTRKQPLERGPLVGREFIRLYYKVMNSYSAYLYLFYEQDSTVVISESRDDDKPLSMQATTRETVHALLCWMYNDVTVNLLSCIPQISLNESILLLISGRIKRKSCNEERFFTQALLLRKQNKGYYIKTDTMHVMSYERSLAFHLFPVSVTEKPSQTAQNEIPTESTKKGFFGRHQPNDSCFECHAELSSHDGINQPPSKVIAKASNAMDTDNEKKEVPTPVISQNTALGEEGSSKPKTIPLRIDCRARSQEGMPLAMHSPLNDVNLTSESTRTAMSAPSALTSLGQVDLNGNDEHRRLEDSATLTPSSHVRMPELTSLFAARLPIGITPATVSLLFSAHGNLKKENAVRVFTGLTNCYACVNFESEEEMRKALEADIKYGTNEIVTEIWRPRDRRGRRIGREFNSRVDMSRSRTHCDT